MLAASAAARILLSAKSLLTKVSFRAMEKAHSAGSAAPKRGADLGTRPNLL